MLRQRADKQDREARDQQDTVRALRRDNRLLRRHSEQTLEKVNFLRNQLNQSLDKDQRVLDSIWSIKQGQESLASLTQRVREVQPNTRNSPSPESKRPKQTY